MYPNLDDYDLSDYEELKGDILYKINGGAEIENSVEAQAQAHEGDTVKRSDGTTHTLTKGDITWAQNQVSNNGGGSSGGSATGNIGDVGGGNASASMGTSAPAGGGQSTGNATATSGNNSAGSTGNYAGGNGNAGNNSRSTKSASEQDHDLKVGLAHVEDYKRTSLAIGTIGVKGKKVVANSVEAEESGCTSHAKISTQQVRELKHVLIPIDGVGLGNVNIQTTYYSDSDGKLSVATSGAYSDRFNRTSVYKYEYYGKVKLLKDGRVVETKPIIRPDGDCVYEAGYDYIGSASFDSPIDSYSNYSVQSDISLVVNKFAWTMKIKHEVTK